VIVIKAQRFRTREKNREDAFERLEKLIKSVGAVKKVRKPTRASKSSQKKRLDSKVKRGRTKALRGRISEE
jgi:ribosome-associated protein